MSGKRRNTVTRFAQDLVDDSKELWDRRVPYPIERGARRVAVGPLRDGDEKTELADLRQDIAGLETAVAKLAEAQRSHRH